MSLWSTWQLKPIDDRLRPGIIWSREILRDTVTFQGRTPVVIHRISRTFFWVHLCCAMSAMCNLNILVILVSGEAWWSYWPTSWHSEECRCWMMLAAHVAMSILCPTVKLFSMYVMFKRIPVHCRILSPRPSQQQTVQTRVQMPDTLRGLFIFASCNVQGGTWWRNFDVSPFEWWFP